MGILTVCATILRYFGRRSDPQVEKSCTEIENLKVRMTHYEVEQKEIWSQVLNLKETYSRESQQTRESIQQLDKKLEKISDLIIELIRNQ